MNNTPEIVKPMQTDALKLEPKQTGLPDDAISNMRRELVEWIERCSDEGITRLSAEKNPRAALEFADKYKDQPYAKEVIEKAQSLLHQQESQTNQ